MEIETWNVFLFSATVVHIIVKVTSRNVAPCNVFIPLVSVPVSNRAVSKIINLTSFTTITASA